MNQEITIIRILRDLKFLDLIVKDITGEFLPDGEYKPFLNAIYTAGYEEGRRSLGIAQERKIEQFNRQGEKIKEFDSILKAAKKVKCSDRLISRALKSGKPTRSGYIWKYTMVSQTELIPQI